MILLCIKYASSALTLLVGRQEGHTLDALLVAQLTASKHRPDAVQPVKKTKWWGAGVVVCLEKGADLHMVQLMELPLTVSCFSKIQIGFTFLVPAHPGSPGKRAVKRLCVCAVSYTHLTLPTKRIV